MKGYPAFAFESFKITLYCLIVTACFYFSGVSNTVLLVVFNMAVMSAAATFSPAKKALLPVLAGSFVIVISIVLGGLLGFYFSIAAPVLTVLYAGCIFWFSRRRYWLNAFINGVVMFLIFTFFPFDLNDGVKYLLFGCIIAVTFALFYVFFDHVAYKEKRQFNNDSHEGRIYSGFLVIVTMVIAYLVAYFLKVYAKLEHVYWVPFTTLVIIQGVQFKTVSTAVKRMLVNTVGALLIVFLFAYVVPTDFWINFLILVVFLFCIFFFGSSYVGRTLFIELFVLSYTHLLGSYHAYIAYDRIIMTLLGGAIVIVMTFVFMGLKRFQS